MLLFSVLASEFSFWWLLLITLVSASLSFFLYRNDKYLREISKTLLILLSSFRFLSLFIIGFFLIKPLITSTKRNLIKPQLLILQDNTESIILTKDSSFYQNDLINQQQYFYKNLEKEAIDYTVYSFSDSIVQERNFTFSKKITDISEALKQAINLNVNNNIGGVLLFSDGIYNKGKDPFYLSKGIQIPIFTVGLGDTTQISDIRIRKININKIGFTDQNIPFSIDIDAENTGVVSTKFRIIENEQILFEEELNIDKTIFYKNINHSIKRLSVGLHRLDFELIPLKNEYNIRNNQQTVYINIIESKQKILLLSSAPHPDLSAINSVLSKQSNYEFESINIRDFSGSIDKYNLIIFHQLPDLRNPIKELIQKINKNTTPILCIITPKTDIKQLNLLKSNIKFAHSLNKNDWLELESNSAFTLFNIDEDLNHFMNNAPPIISPMLKFKTESENSILAFQKIKKIPTDKPAIIFTENENTKFGFIVGEGLWRWKLYNYQNEGNFNNFETLINKISRYLSIRTPKEAFIVDIKNQFEEYEHIEINVQLYNSSFELVNTQDIDLILTSPNGKEYKQILKPLNNVYRGNLGMLKPGRYSYSLKTQLKGKNIYKHGDFVVTPSILENKQLTANHELLRAISNNTNASFYNKDNWVSLIDSIKQHPKFKTKVYSSDELSDLIHLKWILLLLFILLFTEWFIRKYSGTI